MTSITPNLIHSIEIGKDCNFSSNFHKGECDDELPDEYLSHPCTLTLTNGETKTCTLTHLEINILFEKVKIYARFHFAHLSEHFGIEPCGFLCYVPSKEAIAEPYVLGTNQKAQEWQNGRPTVQQILDAIFIPHVSS